MRIAICDDVKRDRECLRDALMQTEIGKCSEVSLFESGEKLLSSINGNAFFDVVFLDVDMPGLDGIETGKRLRNDNKDLVIIFLTSHPEFALDAYECEAFHYLLKPCDTSRISEVLERAASRIGLMRKYHVVKTKQGSARLPIADIYYVECIGRHVIYHMIDEDYTVKEKISDVYDALRDYGFCRVHQGYAVNIDKIKFIGKDEVILTDGRSVMMSVRKRNEVSLAYMKYVEKFTR
ncbi:MAG: response regulator transcription factor [Clostridia bacterium]|nr:response regulator transcription factor [Clostridia bacterium]